MTTPPSKSRPTRDDAALLHELEVRQAELELQNHELSVSNQELQRSNLSLAQARDHYRGLYERAPVALVTLDPRGRILDVNLAAEALLCAPQLRLIERPFGLFVGPAQRAAFGAVVRELFSGAPPRAVETVLVPEDASPIDVAIEAVTILADDERSARAVLSLADVTARKRAEVERRALEQRAQETQRLESLVVLAGGVAHDFNNLLTVVLAGTDHAVRVLGAESPLAGILDGVRQAAVHAGELSHQMLAYSGKVSAPMRALELDALIRAVEPLLRAAAKAVRVVLELQAGLPPVIGDEAQLRQVVINLVINAAEAMQGRDGAIAIAVRTEGDGVVLEVHDQGVGMDEATRARVFEPYFSTKFVGRGLGLAVVQGIVRGHGGSLTIDSAVDRGTTFRVHLPQTERGPRPKSPTPAVPRRTAATVLLVDDDLVVRLAIGRMLEGLGLVVVLASDGDDAVDLVRADRDRFDVVLMDLTMPRMGGVEATRAIRELRDDVPILLSTGYGEIPADAAGLFAGVLRKPYDVAAIRRALATLVSLPVSRA